MYRTEMDFCADILHFNIIATRYNLSLLNDYSKRPFYFLPYNYTCNTLQLNDTAYLISAAQTLCRAVPWIIV